jgi:hypothetical protein
LAGCANAVPPNRATVKAAISGVRNICNVSIGCPFGSEGKKPLGRFNVKAKIKVISREVSVPFMHGSGRV